MSILCAPEGPSASTKKNRCPVISLTRLLEVARYAQTGSNSQPVHWLVIQEAKEVNRLAGLVADWVRFMLKENTEYALSMHMDRLIEAWDKGMDRILRDAPHLIVAHGLSTLACFSAGLYHCPDSPGTGRPVTRLGHLLGRLFYGCGQ